MIVQVITETAEDQAQAELARYKVEPQMSLEQNPFSGGRITIQVS